MTNLIKGVAITAPALVIIFAAAWFQTRESTTEIRAESAAFDAQFAQQQQAFATGSGKDFWRQQQIQAQARHSSAQADFIRQKKNIDNRDVQINAGVDGADADLAGKLK